MVLKIILTVVEVWRLYNDMAEFVNKFVKKNIGYYN